MLVLTRRRNQKIRIGDGWVHVLDVKNGQARLGFEFPPGVEIVREEAKKKERDDKRGHE